MERKIWIRSQGENLFPNLYTILVGPPGSGKTRALEACERIWRGLDTHKLAKVSLTKASLMDELGLAVRVVRHPVEMTFNSLLIACKELGALIPSYDTDFLNALTYLYDCYKYDEKRRHTAEPLIIDHPQVNLIACTTPSYLVNTMPAGAWDQGFLSRIILVYSGDLDPTELDLLDEHEDEHRALREALARDMKAIGERVGRLKFTRPAAQAIETWNKNGRQPAPSHPRLTNYSTRRIVHLLKLCMVSCVDRGAENIDLPDFQNALEWLVEAESFMPDVFTAMQSGGDAVVINEAWHFAIVTHARTGRGVPMHLFYTFLQQRVPAMHVSKIFEVMLNSGMIRVITQDGVQLVVGKPR